MFSRTEHKLWHKRNIKPSNIHESIHYYNFFAFFADFFCVSANFWRPPLHFNFVLSYRRRKKIASTATIVDKEWRKADCFAIKKRFIFFNKKTWLKSFENVVDEFVFDETERRRFAPRLDGPGIEGITVFSSSSPTRCKNKLERLFEAKILQAGVVFPTLNTLHNLRTLPIRWSACC